MSKEANEAAVIQPEHIILVGKTSGRELKLERTVDQKGVVFYEAPLNWRTPPVASDK